MSPCYEASSLHLSLSWKSPTFCSLKSAVAEFRYLLRRSPSPTPAFVLTDGKLEMKSRVASLKFEAALLHGKKMVLDAFVGLYEQSHKAIAVVLPAYRVYSTDYL